MKKNKKIIGFSILAVVLIVVGKYVYDMNINHNFETITEEKVYKSGVIPPNEIEGYVKKYNIKSIIDLRMPGTNDLVLNPEKFVHLEHTDGYNYASIELEHYNPVYQSPKSRFAIDWMQGVGIGALVPRSDVHVFGVGQNNFWNLAGGGASVKTGLKFNLTKLVFFETTFKTGATKLWDIRTTGRSVDHAEQAIYFVEFYGALGFTIKGSSK